MFWYPLSISPFILGCQLRVSYSGKFVKMPENKSGEEQLIKENTEETVQILIFIGTSTIGTLLYKFSLNKKFNTEKKKINYTYSFIDTGSSFDDGKNEGHFNITTCAHLNHVVNFIYIGSFSGDLYKVKCENNRMTLEKRINIRDKIFFIQRQSRGHLFIDCQSDKFVILDHNLENRLDFKLKGKGFSFITIWNSQNEYYELYHAGFNSRKIYKYIFRLNETIPVLKPYPVLSKIEKEIFANDELQYISIPLATHKSFRCRTLRITTEFNKNKYTILIGSEGGYLYQIEIDKQNAFSQLNLLLNNYIKHVVIEARDDETGIRQYIEGKIMDEHRKIKSSPGILFKGYKLQDKIRGIALNKYNSKINVIIIYHFNNKNNIDLLEYTNNNRFILKQRFYNKELDWTKNISQAKFDKSGDIFVACLTDSIYKISNKMFIDTLTHILVDGNNQPESPIIEITNECIFPLKGIEVVSSDKCNNGDTWVFACGTGRQVKLINAKTPGRIEDVKEFSLFSSCEHALIREIEQRSNNYKIFAFAGCTDGNIFAYLVTRKSDKPIKYKLELMNILKVENAVQFLHIYKRNNDYFILVSCLHKSNPHIGWLYFFKIEKKGLNFHFNLTYKIKVPGKIDSLVVKDHILVMTIIQSNDMLYLLNLEKLKETNEKLEIEAYQKIVDIINQKNINELIKSIKNYIFNYIRIKKNTRILETYQAYYLAEIIGNLKSEVEKVRVILLLFEMIQPKLIFNVLVDQKQNTGNIKRIQYFLEEKQKSYDAKLLSMRKSLLEVCKELNEFNRFYYIFYWLMKNPESNFQYYRHGDNKLKEKALSDLYFCEYILGRYKYDIKIFKEIEGFCEQFRMDIMKYKRMFKNKFISIQFKKLNNKKESIIFPSSNYNLLERACKDHVQKNETFNIINNDKDAIVFIYKEDKSNIEELCQKFNSKKTGDFHNAIKSMRGLCDELKLINLKTNQVCNLFTDAPLKTADMRHEQKKEFNKYEKLRNRTFLLVLLPERQDREEI